MQAWLPWVADGLAVLGLVVLTISVYGILRVRDIKIQLHAAGKAGTLGVLPIAIAATLDSDSSSILKALLVGGFLLLTTPIVAHEIGRAAHTEPLGEEGPSAGDGPIDSGDRA